jgi:hypothetical protein
MMEKRRSSFDEKYLYIVPVLIPLSFDISRMFTAWKSFLENCRKTTGYRRTFNFCGIAGFSAVIISLINDGI